jgi:hypothetical protein
MVWPVGKMFIQEMFRHNQCVAIQYTPAPGRYLYESAIWELLQTNSKAGDHWHTYHTDSVGDPEFVNGDGSLYGKYFVTTEGKGALRICYATWLKRHGMLGNEDANANPTERPPVEDSDGANVNL